MGTTIVALATAGEHAVIGHVGDSRVYRLREGEVEALTQDHSLYNQMCRAGTLGLPDARSFRLSNVITQAVGQSGAVSPDLATETILEGDRLLLCSDGLSDVLHEDELVWLLQSKHDVAKTLARAAYEAGSRDNITALVLTAS